MELAKAHPSLQLAELSQAEIGKGSFAGYVCLIAKGERKLWFSVGGHRQLVPRELRMERDSIFDLASLTKPIVTATLTMIAIERGYFQEEQMVKEILPEAKFLDSITISDLCAHRSGLPAWLPLYETVSSKREMMSKVFEVKPEREPRKSEIYSDIGYIVLGHLIEKTFGRDLKTLSEEIIFSRLGMTETCYLPPPDLVSRAVATELTEDGNPLIGKVHDENARAMGGVSGHAGLFSKAEDLLKFANMLLNGGTYAGSRILREESVAAMTKNKNGEIGGYFGYGWVTKKPGSIFPESCSDDSFGHTGFTGTSIAVDRKRQLISIILTNAVHPRRKDSSINEYRRRVFELGIKLLEEVG